jgi:hypothetical protein
VGVGEEERDDTIGEGGIGDSNIARGGGDRVVAQ